MKKILMSIALLVSSIPLLGSNCSTSCETSCKAVSSCDDNPCSNPKTTYLPRSQANNRAREMAGWYMNWAYDKVEPRLDHIYGSGSIAVEYSRSFRPNVITDFLFGSAAKNGAVYFSGSQVANRGTRDVLADYFGLPQDYQGRVSFDPVIQNVIIDLNAYFGLDKFCNGMFLDVHMPIVNTRWALNPCVCTEVIGTASYQYGYMTKLGVDRSKLAQDPLQFWSGNFIFGDVKTPLKNAKVACDTLTETKLADIHINLGYNWCQNDLAHFGYYGRAAFPTGNRPVGEYLFEPIVGNGGHFELGGGINSHAVLWENDRNHQLSAYFDIYISHLFGATQKRSMDLVGNGVGSRYILLATNYPQPVDAAAMINLNHVNNPGLVQEYAGEIVPGANVATLCCRSTFGMQSELTLKFEYMLNNFTFDVGYNFWGRTREKVVTTDTIDPVLYSIKGDAYLYGVRVAGVATPSTLTNGTVAAAHAGYPTNSVALGVAESNATFFAGTNYNPRNTGATPQLNFGVDSPTAATASDGAGNSNVVISPIASLGVTAVNYSIQTSNALTTIAASDYDPDTTAQPSQISQKLFLNATYTGKEAEVFTRSTMPYIGLGGEVEFGAKNQTFGCAECGCSGALSQWGVWVKGGFTY